MAAKAELFGDKEIRDQILKCSDQKQIKALGRNCLLYTSSLCFLTWSTESKTIWKKPIFGICPAVNWQRSNLSLIHI